MSREEWIKLPKITKEDIFNHVLATIEFEDSRNFTKTEQYAILQKTLTSPTADEVCRELIKKVKILLAYIDDQSVTSSKDNFKTYVIERNGNYFDSILNELQQLVGE
jgi:hypothetical protein